MATAYLTRNTGGTGTSGKKFTISFWMKCADTTNSITMFSASSNSLSSPFTLIRRNSTGALRFTDYTNNTTERASKITNRLLRDPSAWYHIVIAVDTDQSTASERNRIYINGVEETSFATDINYSSGATTSMGQNNEMVIGRYEPYNSNYFDGIISHFHYADGQQYAPTVFGETDSTSGIWKPKTSPSVSYGTNGFFLDFADSSALGDDESGNTNDFTVNGTITQTEDSPSNNFATLNPLLDVNAVGTYSNGNLGFTGTGSTNFGGCSMPVSKGKWYVEVKTTVSGSYYPMLGVIDAQSTLRRNSVYFTNTDVDTNNPSGFGVQANGDIYHNADNTYGNLGTTYTTGDIIGLALDMDSATKTLGFYKNGTLQTTINLDDPPSGSYIFCASIYATYSSAKTDWNFGNGYFGTTAVASSNSDSAGLGLFEYSVPSGYYSLCTKNIKNYG